MNLSTQLLDELKRLAGYSGPGPQTVALTTPEGNELQIDLTAVDSLSSSFREIRLHVPSLATAGFDALRQWAEAFSQRVTYLLEGIGPVELDPDAGEVLVRSTPPDRQGTVRQFYEIRLQSHSGGRFSLRRYRTERGVAGREQVELHATHEVLRKLVTDLVDTIPATS